jgi:predicted TIM-barrel fold metal-dependent hydrolase
MPKPMPTTYFAYISHLRWTVLVPTLCGFYLECSQGLKPIWAQNAIPNPPPASPDLRLFDFFPSPRLRTQETRLARAKFPVIDIHTHFSVRLRDDPAALDAFVQVMDRNGIALCVSLDGTLGSKLASHLRYLQEHHPDRFLVFANIDFQGDAAADDHPRWACNQPDFVHRTVLQLREAHRQGHICGLKIFKQLGLGYRQADGRLWTVDDPRLDPIWAECGSLGIPVLMHIGDPSAFFEPIDPTNERYEELARHPDWAFPPPRFPKRSELHEARNRVIARHPKTQFILAHFGNDAEDLEQTASWLDRYPNVSVELASRISELGRQPYSAARFFHRYQDRILFGTDGPWPEARLGLYWRFLETADEHFPYSEKPFPPQGFWRIHGIHLPDEILMKVYQSNAVRWIPGAAERLQRSGFHRYPELGFRPVEIAGHAAFQIGDRIWSGPRPEDSADWEALETLGISAIISVDGLSPAIELAARHGMAYVHIPFGYDGVPTASQVQLAASMQRYPGKIYLHGHHGRHRGPAAAAIAAMSCGLLSRERAMELMERAGTGKNYRRLWEDVRRWSAPGPLSLSTVKLQSVAQEASLAKYMAQLDQHWSKLAKEWKDAPAELSSSAPSLHATAVLIRESFEESRRLMEIRSTSEDVQDLLNRLDQSLRDARALESALESNDGKQAKALQLQLQSHCTQCHDKHRL